MRVQRRIDVVKALKVHPREPTGDAGHEHSQDAQEAPHLSIRVSCVVSIRWVYFLSSFTNFPSFSSTQQTGISSFHGLHFRIINMFFCDY
ncbi:hypothetical protein E2C01_005883 [Portunus trituberculatus]|uniref:Uncharacterized protein n=1 Tax=Portunus trituberculatus TaxID=210409 RepID=A0A5B7D0B2_PORTR|nr:hypothetical protein [Portunus trituberculatus]